MQNKKQKSKVKKKRKSKFEAINQKQLFNYK